MDDVFLLVSLFFPRATLIVYYFMGQMPFNTVPFALDIILAAIIPRLLILIYIIQNNGMGSTWFWLHIITAILIFIVSILKGKSE